MARARDALDELGMPLFWAGLSICEGEIEHFAGDLEQAATILREGAGRFAAVGETAYRSSVVGGLGLILAEQGRWEEALAAADEAADLAAERDLFTQIQVRRTRAEVLAARGEPEEAERLAREAIAIADATDSVLEHGHARVTLAVVLERAGRANEAAAVAETALERYAAKGATACAAWAQRRLGALVA